MLEVADVMVMKVSVAMVELVVVMRIRPRNAAQHQASPPRTMPPSAALFV